MPGQQICKAPFVRGAERRSEGSLQSKQRDGITVLPSESRLISRLTLNFVILPKVSETFSS